MSHLTEEPAPLSSLHNNIPVELAELIHSCLSKQPDDRPQDMRTLKKRFLQIKGNTGLNLTRYKTTEEKGSTPPDSKKASGSNRWIAYLGLAALLMLLIAGAFIHFNSKKAGSQAQAPSHAKPSINEKSHVKANGDSASTMSNPYTVKDKRVLTEGALLFGTHCAKCHGTTGDGNGSETPAHISPKALNIQDISPGVLDAYRFKVIREGLTDLMPSFSEELSQDDTWKVVTFVNTLAAGEGPSLSNGESTDDSSLSNVVEPTLTADEKKAGAKLYARHCESCHGSKGAGHGRAAEYLGRKPANLRMGVYKIRSTPKDSIPTNLDIYRTLTKGMGVHGMPSFKKLPSRDRWSLVSFIKSFSKRFQNEKPGEAISIPAPPVLDAQSAQRGKELYQFSACTKCHGKEGKGDGPKSDEIIARVNADYRLPNFAVKGSFIGGHEPKDIYKTLMTGLAGTPMPAGTDFFTEEEAWDVVAYILSFSSN